MGLLFLSGPLMVGAALAFVIGWIARSRTPLRWFWAGAGIWAVAVALKVLWGVGLNKPILSGFEVALPRVGYLFLGSVYVGLLTGIFEIGVTLAAARIWRALAVDGARAVAVGVGAGAFEAMLLGVAGLIAVLVAASDLPGGAEVRVAIASQAAATPLPWLLGPVERVIAILCHTGSRAMVLLSVATRRWSYFWYGFLLMTAIDAIAGLVHLSGIIGKVSMWWVELGLVPFAGASVLLTRWCLQRWPTASPPGSRGQLPVQVP